METGTAAAAVSASVGRSLLEEYMAEEDLCVNMTVPATTAPMSNATAAERMRGLEGVGGRGFRPGEPPSLPA